jgi:hypothetical protein
MMLAGTKLRAIRGAGYSTGVVALLFAVGTLLAAPMADADTGGFYDYLEGKGIDTSSSDEVRAASLNMGQSICGLFAAYDGEGDSARATVDGVLENVTIPQSTQWIVGSVDYLCPRYEWMLSAT